MPAADRAGPASRDSVLDECRVRASTIDLPCAHRGPKSSAVDALINRQRPNGCGGAAPSRARRARVSGAGVRHPSSAVDPPPAHNPPCTQSRFRVGCEWGMCKPFVSWAARRVVVHPQAIPTQKHGQEAVSAVAAGTGQPYVSQPESWLVFADTAGVTVCGSRPSDHVACPAAADAVLAEHTTKAFFELPPLYRARGLSKGPCERTTVSSSGSASSCCRQSCSEECVSRFA